MRFIVVLCSVRAEARPFISPKRERTPNRIKEFEFFCASLLLVIEFEDENDDEDEEGKNFAVARIYVR